MTSNFAIGSTASIAPASNLPPSGDIARVLNPATLSGSASAYGDGQRMAAGLRRPGRPPKPPAPEPSKTRVAPGANKPPVIAAPIKIKGGQTWTVPGAPKLNGQINRELLWGLNRAFTPERVRVFQSLSESQQITARTLIDKALDAMRLPAGNAGRIDPKDMGAAVDAALTHAQQTPPTAKPVAPASTTQRTPTTKPVLLPRTPTTPLVQPARTRTAAPVEPATPLRPSSESISLALKIRNFGNSAAAIASTRNYSRLLDSLDGLQISTVVRVGNSGVDQFNAPTLLGRSRQYRDASIHNLNADSGDDYFSLQMSGGNGTSHQLHTVLGATSKLGEVHAAGQAFTFAQQSWESRGKLPGQDGKPLSAFWGVQSPAEWNFANQALTRLESLTSPPDSAQFSRSIVAELHSKGFIPKGSVLSSRLERLEAAMAQRDTLQKQLEMARRTPSADLAQTRALQERLQAATQDVQRGLADARGRATQSRGELLMQSLGTPKTTYELTIRHATAARYMQSIEGQADARFSASKFKALMAEVKKEAGPEAKVSQLWHRALIERYSKDATFRNAMTEHGTAMKEAWTAYKAQYGL
jgi:hypothetical protein